MNPSQKWRLATSLSVAVVLLALFLRGVEWPELRRALGEAHPLPLLGLVVATLGTYGVRAWRWGFLLEPLGRVPLPRLFKTTMIGFLAGLVIPRAGEVLRPYLISRSHGIATSAGFATIVLERLLDLATVLALFAVYLFLLPAPIQQTKGPLMGLLKVAGALTGVLALAVFGVLLAFHHNAARALAFFERVFSRLPRKLASPARHALAAFGDGLAVLQAPIGHLAALFGQSLLLWLGIALTFHLNNAAFSIDLPFHANFLLIAFLTVGVSIPTPGMVGGFHAFFLWALNDAFGVPRDLAVAAGLVAHALSNLPVLVLGLVFLGQEGLTFGKVAEMTGQRDPARPDPHAGRSGPQRAENQK